MFFVDVWCLLVNKVEEITDLACFFWFLMFQVEKLKKSVIWHVFFAFYRFWTEINVFDVFDFWCPVQASAKKKSSEAWPTRFCIPCLGKDWCRTLWGCGSYSLGSQEMGELDWGGGWGDPRALVIFLSKKTARALGGADGVERAAPGI